MKTFREFITEAAKKPSSNVDDFMNDYHGSTTEHPFDSRSRIHNNAATVEIQKIQGRARLSDMRALSPGGGSAALDHIKSLADNHGVDIEGTAKAYAKSKKYPMSTKQLAGYYKKRGFQVNRGNASDGYDILYKAQKKLDEMKKPRYEVPAEPGSTPVPDGKVKVYHQTDGKNISSIRKKGIESRQPVEGPRGIYGAEPNKKGEGFYGHPNHTPTIEFHVDKKDWKAPFVHRDKVEPDKIVAAHKPWHSTVRYIDADPELRKDIETDKDGEYSKMINDPNHRKDKTARGVRFVMKRAKAQKK